MNTAKEILSKGVLKQFLIELEFYSVADFLEADFLFSTMFHICNFTIIFL